MKRNGVWKIFTIIGALLISILLCYFSIALYFYLSSSNDIAKKLKVWNLMSDQSLGEMYLDASFRVSNGENSFYGVNIDESGYVLTLANEIDENETYSLYQKNGKIFEGEVVFIEESFNLAVLKLYDLNGEKINLPFVKIGSLTSSDTSTLVSVGDPLEKNNIISINTLIPSIYTDELTKFVDGKEIVQYVNKTPYYYRVKNYENYSQGGVFNNKGELLGLCYKQEQNNLLQTIANCYLVDVSYIEFVLEDIKEENVNTTLSSALCGFDMFELQSYLIYPLSSSSNAIFFNDKWIEVSDEMLTFYYSSVDGVFLVEDFSYNDVTIPKNSFIINVSTSLFTFDIYTTEDLISIFYLVDKGENLTISYQNLEHDEVFSVDMLV